MVKQSKWIKVSDRLPETEDVVKVRLDSRRILPASYNKSENYWTLLDPSLPDGVVDVTHGKVIEWMPIEHRGV